jgi:hypothetical protein
MRNPIALATFAVPLAASVLGGGEANATPSACGAISGNLVANCGFETTTDWSPSVNQHGTPHTGSFGEFLGNNNNSQVQALVEQTIPTVSGDTYQLTFWAEQTVPAFHAKVSFGGDSVTSFGGGFLDYQEFTTTVTATSSSSILEFDTTGEGTSSYGSIDDVSLVLISTGTAAAPEPASFGLLGAGLAGLAGLRRRRR